MYGDMTFDGDLIVDGDISGKDDKKYTLVVKENIDALGNINAGNIDAVDIKVVGNINALTINARNVDALGNIDALAINARNIEALGNIKAQDINARNIYTQDIDARNIDASFIVCETLNQKEGAKLVCRNIIRNKRTYAKKEMR